MHSQRKLDHLRICLEEDVSFESLRTGLERVRLIHQALPELSLDAVDLRTEFLGKQLAAPLLVSAMTGGAESAEIVNRNLATAAQRFGVAMSVGSQRAALADPAMAVTYQVRDVAPDVLLFANLGAVQLNYGYGVNECRQAVDMIGADALVLHLNPLQECLQDKGNTDFTNLLIKIESVCSRLSVPVVVKEVGWGLSERVARELISVGVSGLDVAGAGGTCWALVEKLRGGNQVLRRVADAFADWGIPTADSVRMVRSVSGSVPLIASGGIRTGVDAAKCLCLGANLAGMALPLLKPATVSQEAVVDRLGEVALEMRIAMLCSGAARVSDLDAQRLTPPQPVA